MGLCAPATITVRILDQQLYMHQIFGARLDDVHYREIDLASQQRLTGGCRVGCVDVKREARVRQGEACRARARPAFDAGPGFWLSCRKLARLCDVMGERATSRGYSGSCTQ